MKKFANKIKYNFKFLKTLMEVGNLNILKKSIRQRRAISSGLYDNISCNYSEEEKNRSKNSIKSYHRKTSTSYFCGSYLSSNLEDELLNNLNIDKIYFEKNKKEEKKDNKNQNICDIDNNLDIYLNYSFHSYDSDKSIEKNDENNKKEKTNENENKKKENKINNNFVSFKNNLKNLKYKNEKATKSYLLALGMVKNQNRKEQYVPTASVIEEEKSDVIESVSEFSNKKMKKSNNKYIFDNYFLNKDLFFINKENKLKIKNIIERKKKIKEKKKEENKNNSTEKEVKEKNNNFGIKLSFALNEIMLKNNKKEENKRKYLKNNKTLILNSFFNFKKNNEGETIKEKIKIDNENNKNAFKNTENNEKNLTDKFRNKIEKKFQLSLKEKIRNSYVTSFIKKRYNTENNIIDKNNSSIKNKIIFANKKIKSSQKNKDNEHSKERKSYILYNTINSNININKEKNNSSTKKKVKVINEKNKSNIPIITKIEYKPYSKIPHIRQKIIERKELNSLSNMNINISNNNKNNSNKNSAPNRKYISKYKNIPRKKNFSFTKDKSKDNKENYKSIKQFSSINETLEIIRIEKIKSKSKNKDKSTSNRTNNSKRSIDYSSSFIKDKKFNSKSSRDKEKNNKILFKKANSGTFRNDISLKLIGEKTLKHIGNKNSTVNALKNYIKYEKNYIKIDVINKIEKKFDLENSFFIISCQKLENFFIFKSILKLYKKENRFIKIYGNVHEPNVISIKNINANNFDIFLISIKNEICNCILIDELKFNLNAIIICKK